MTSTPAFSATGGAPDDEAFWSRVRDAFPRRQGPLNLLNSGGGRSPQQVVDRLKDLIQVTAAGGEKLDPVLREHSESGSSPALRQLMAEAFGCGADEIALTRNAMEGLAIGLLGIDLRPGDEVLTTQADYDACIEILRQRQRREGIVVKIVTIPMPACSSEEVVAVFRDAIGERTRLILCSHMVNKNGQILPVREICALARRQGIVSIVDGAQTVGHIDFALRDIGCDIYATSLHKWYHAPRGTGFLHVRREMISKVWPIWASWSGKADDSIEKFEDYGTCMKAVAATLFDVAAFNAAIGPARKEARLRHLRDLWLEPVSRMPRVMLMTDIHPSRSCAIAAFAIDGMSPDDAVRRLRDDAQIIVGSVRLPEAPQLLRSIGVAADLSNSPEEIERFVDAVGRLVSA
jgi:isopenicillin-N epimerase